MKVQQIIQFHYIFTRFFFALMLVSITSIILFYSGNIKMRIGLLIKSTNTKSIKVISHPLESNLFNLRRPSTIVDEVDIHHDSQLATHSLTIQNTFPNSSTRILGSTSIKKAETIKTIMAWHGWSVMGNIYKADQLKNFEETSQTMCKHRCKIVLQEQSQSHESADLVILDLSGLPSVPPVKYKDQLWLFRTIESPFNINFDLSVYNGLINYTFTLHPYSTVVDMYGYKQARPSALPAENYAQMKRRLMTGASRTLNALWQVSNCWLVHSGRMEYASEIAKHMLVDVVTRNDFDCGSKIPGARINPPIDECELCNYTFYLSFENALCKDYITEKLWKILVSDKLAIPIVMGGYDMQEYVRVAPPNSFIHIRNFSSPEDLVEHLDYVVKNDDAFNYYHQWRRDLTAVSTYEHGKLSTYCDICHLAHERPQQVVENLDNFYTLQECHQGA